MVLPFVWIGGLLASAIVVHEVVKPRLPAYKITPILGFPQLRWGTGDENQVWLGMPVSVSMHNDNFLEVDVYSLVFDMFYMDEEGSLLHLADISDHNQATSTAKRVGNNHKTNASNPEILWQIPSRSNFTINDSLFMSVESTILWNLLLNPRFYASIWKGYGSFWLPTTGVAHVKAIAKGKAGVPATLKIICDNFIENFIVQGLSCVLHDAGPGWSNITEASLSMRQHVTTKLKANSDGVVLVADKPAAEAA